MPTPETFTHAHWFAGEKKNKEEIEADDVKTDKIGFLFSIATQRIGENETFSA